jgi:hypothetical protein
MKQDEMMLIDLHPAQIIGWAFVWKGQTKEA